MINNKCSDVKENCCSSDEKNSNIENQNELTYQNKIKDLEQLLIDQEKNTIYLKADMENIRRNNAKEIQYAVNRQVHKIIANFLSVLDDYERSLQYAQTLNLKELSDGLMITYNAFYKVLQDLEVKEIDCSKEFNPEFHDAITTCIDETKESNTIHQVIQKGFLYKNQVIRPAKVIIVA